MGIILTLVTILLSSVPSLHAMECNKSPYIFTWDSENIVNEVQKATRTGLKNALYEQAYAAFLLAQRISFMGDADENHTPPIQLITLHRTIIKTINQKEYYFEDAVQVKWLYILAKIMAALKKESKLSDTLLFSFAWKIRLFLDDCATPLLKSTLENNNKEKTDYFIRASTIAIYSTQILDDLINLGIFRAAPQGIRARYIKKMVSLFPQALRSHIPPLNNEIVVILNNDSISHSPTVHFNNGANDYADGTSRLPIDNC